MLELDPLQYVLLAAVVAGVTEMLTRARAKDWWVVATIATSGLVGLVFGLLGLEGLDPVEGLAVGFGLSGGIKVLSALGNRSTPAPSDVLVKK